MTKPTDEELSDKVSEIEDSSKACEELQKALQESERWFRTLFELTGDYAMLLEATAKKGLVIVDANQRACDFHGYSREEFIGLNIREIDTGTSHEQEQERLKKVLAGETAFFEVVHAKKDGTSFTAEVSAKLLDIENDRALIIAVERDVSKRRQTEQKLQELLNLNQLAINSSPVGIMVFRESGPCVIANPAAETIAGAPAEQLLKLNYPEIKSYRENGILADFERALETGEIIKREVHTTNTFGKEVWFEGVVSVFELENKKHILFMFEDIFERKQAEAEKEKLKERLKLVVEASRDGFWDWNIETGDLYISPRWHEQLGYEMGDLPLHFETLKTVCHPEDYPHAMDVIQQHLESKPDKPYEIEHRFKTKTGEWKWILARGKVFYDQKGKAKRMIGTTTDIDDRKQEEEKLRQSEEQFRSLAEHSPNIIARFDRKLRHMYINPAIEKIAGIPAAAFIGKTNEELGMPAVEVARWNRKLRAAFKKGIAHYFEFTFQPPRRPEKTYTFFSRLIPEYGQEGFVKHILAITTDITDIVTTERKLRASKEQLEEQFFLLERKNLALQEMIQQVQDERNRTQKQILANVEQFILPLTNRAKSAGSGDASDALQVIEENLKAITSDFGEKVGNKLLRLTKREIEVSNMVKNGLTSKEIANLLQISTRGVETHRRNIRRKLGVTNNKINLSTYLSSL